MSNYPIYVTQPHIPPLGEFILYLEQIRDSKILTNGGPLHQQLEAALSEYLGVEHILLFAFVIHHAGNPEATRYLYAIAKPITFFVYILGLNWIVRLVRPSWIHFTVRRP